MAFDQNAMNGRTFIASSRAEWVAGSAVSSPGRSWLIVLPFLCCVLPAVPSNLDAFVRFGPVSLNGLLAILQFFLFAAALAALPRFPAALVARLAPIGGFLVWAMVRSLAGVTFGGVQNLVVYLGFGAAVAVAGAFSDADRERAIAAVARGITWLDLVALPSLLLLFVAYGLPRDVDSWPIPPRGFVITALLPFAWHSSRWRAGRARDGAWALLWFVAIAVTLSRTATVAAVGIALVSVLLRLRWQPARLLGTLLPDRKSVV
jgi:hypothetical protein